jgi:transcriptional regulator with XRE-family HTH domain
VNLKAARLNRGLTVADAAGQIGVLPHVLRDAENLGTVPRPASAKLIADFYGLQVTDVWPVEERAA